MPTKDERLEMRVSEHDRDVMEDAAKRLHEPVSDFVRSAAVTRAQQVLAVAAFYRKHDIVPVKGNPHRLILKIATARKAMGVT